jgi:threonine dehydratase
LQGTPLGGDLEDQPRFDAIEEAHRRIRYFIHRTPVFTCRAIDDMCGASLFFKCENFQKAGAFKIRGACNAVFSLTDGEARCGVATHSSGNHAAALALAARWRGVPAYVVMPDNAPGIKKAAVAGYGASLFFCKPTLEAREEGLARVLERTGAAFVHPFNDARVIAGQGTACLELCEEVQHLDVVMAPVGGGGLLSGTSIAAASMSQKTAVIGTEPEKADDAYRSLQKGAIVPAGNPETIADGLRTSLGHLTFSVIRKNVRQIVTVSEEGIVQAMRTVWERMKIIIEPSAAVPLGALLTHRIDLSGKRVGIILSGGNLDLDRLPWLSASPFPSPQK